MMLRLCGLLCLLVAVAGYRFRMGWYSYSIDPPYGGTESQPFPVIPAFCPTSYSLLTWSNRDHPEVMFATGHKPNPSSCFDPELDTYFVIHGMWHTPAEAWVDEMCQDILDVKPANCIIMDWSSCTWDFLIRQPQDARVLGADLADFICHLEETYGCDLGKIWLLASNVAAHIAGHAGKLKNGQIGYIVAFDPTASVFSGDDRLHLTKDDALCVQVIHTDADPDGPFSFGFIGPQGDIDIYPNGGRNMPECPPHKSTLEEVLCLMIPAIGPLSCSDLGFPSPERCAELMGDREVVLRDFNKADYDYFCTHHQATNYFKDSIKNSRKYLGLPCKSVEDCRNRVTQPCHEGQCRQLGFFAKCDGSGPQMYYLNVTVLPVLS